MALAYDATVATICTQTAWGHHGLSQCDIPSGPGKSSSRALRGDREDPAPNFFSPGEVPGSGRATLRGHLTVTLRVFCHQPCVQGHAAGEPLSWNDLLCRLMVGSHHLKSLFQPKRSCDSMMPAERLLGKLPAWVNPELTFQEKLQEMRFGSSASQKMEQMWIVL